MVSLKISIVLKLVVCFVLLLIASPIFAIDNAPRIRKMGMEYKNVGKDVVVTKAKRPLSADAPWGGGYNIP